MPSNLANQLTKLKKEKTLLWVLIFSLVAIVCWIIVTILSSRREEIIGEELRELAKPLVPTLDRKILEQLSEKNYFSDDELDNFSIFSLVELEGGGREAVDIVNNRSLPRLEKTTPQDTQQLDLDIDEDRAPEEAIVNEPFQDSQADDSE